MTAPRPAGATPPDTLPPRRGGHASPLQLTAGRPAGFARLRAARRALFRSARALAARTGFAGHPTRSRRQRSAATRPGRVGPQPLVHALLVAIALLLPGGVAQAQEAETLVSNIGQGSTLTADASVQRAQRFTTGPYEYGYTLSTVDVVSVDAEGTSFEAKVCTVDGDAYPTSTCTDLAAPGSSAFAAGTITFYAPFAPSNIVLEPGTTYAVVLTTPSEGDVEVTYGLTTAEEWQAEVTPDPRYGASNVSFTMSNTGGRWPELTGTVRTDGFSQLSVRVRGRFGDDGWGAWSPVTGLYCWSSSSEGRALVTILAAEGARSVTEGTEVKFTLTRELPTATEVMVKVSVTERGAVIETAGAYEPPEEVTFTAGDTTTTLTVLTEDDEQQESDGAVIATLQPGPEYRLGQSSTRTAQMTVEDDEGGGPPGPIGPGGPPGPVDTTRPPSAPRNLEALGGDEQVTLFWEVPEDDDGFPITDYEYLISGTGGGWISTGSTETTHTVTELVNGRVYLFQVRAVSAAGAGNSSHQVEVTPGVGRLEFAHFANGSSITSDLVLVNVFARPIRPSLYFYNREGDRIAVESVLEVTEELEVAEDGSLTVQTEMQPLQALTISTHGQGELVAGSVTVLSNGPIGGVLRFDLPGVGVAGVGAGQPLRDALFPARRQAGGISTAAAIRNLEAEELVVSCRLMQEGAVLEEVDIELKVNGQDGRFIEEVFTTTDTTDFVGMVRCTRARGKTVRRSGGGAGCRQRDLHHLAGAAGRPDGLQRRGVCP